MYNKSKGSLFRRDNMIPFINTFLSYLLLFLVIVVLGAIAITIGITLAKKKNAQNPAVTENEKSGAVNG